MDFLGSILNSMQKPPVNAERKKAKEQSEALERLQQQEKQKLSEFRSQIQERIEKFIKNCFVRKLKLEPMEKTRRAIVHEVADVAGLVSYSFGQEEIDRYVIIWKKEFAPSELELSAYRNEEEWSEEKEKQRKNEMAAWKAELAQRVKNKKQEVKPAADYHSKYEHLLGKEAALGAAQLTSANKSYGFVPSENKRDHRTIEEVMADTKARKRQKVDSSQSTADSYQATADSSQSTADSCQSTADSCQSTADSSKSTVGSSSCHPATVNTDTSSKQPQ